MRELQRAEVAGDYVKLIADLIALIGRRGRPMSPSIPALATEPRQRWFITSAKGWLKAALIARSFSRSAERRLQRCLVIGTGTLGQTICAYHVKRFAI